MHNARFRARLKSFVFEASGIQRVLEKRARGASVLMYHGLTERVRYPGTETFLIEVETFRKHLKFLKARYDPVPLSRIIGALREGGEIPSRWVAVTLDDCLASQVTTGANLLREFGVPWSLTVPAGLVGTKRSVWTYEVGFLLLHCWTGETIPLLGADEGLPARDAEERRQALKRVRQWLFDEASGSERQAYIEGLIDAVGRERFLEEMDSYGQLSMADWSHVRHLADEGVEILSHGWSHWPHGTRLSSEELRREIVDSHTEIDARVGAAPKGFALPHGRRMADADKLMREAGYEFCVTSQPARVIPGCSLLSVPRFDGEYPLPIMRRHMLGHG